jgi:hypothetical protein
MVDGGLRIVMILDSEIRRNDKKNVSKDSL